MKIQELLTDSTKWTQGEMSLAADGRIISSSSDEAVCWCLLGAMIKCYSKPLEVMVKVKEYLEVDNLAGWNDSPTRTFDDIRKLVTNLDL